MKSDIIIVNWNSGHQLSDCIDSVRKYHCDCLGRCVVVDNGSVDGSADFLLGAKDVILIQAGKNIGFGAACNLGYLQSASPLILFLNPDARLMPSSLSVSSRFLQSPENSHVGIVGVQLIGDDGSVQRSCARFPTPFNLALKSLGIAALVKRADFQMKDWDHLGSRMVDQVMGAFFFIRRDLFDKMKGFDERFFVYFEEVDLSRRSALAGFSTFYISETQAYHKGGGVSEQVKAFRLFYSLRSRIQYSFKHFSVFSAIAVAMLSMIVEPVIRLMQLISKGRLKELPDLFRAYWMLWVWAAGKITGNQALKVN